MKKIIPFKKQLTFKTNISEITSISLENTLRSDIKSIEGDLIISGTYKITDASIQVDDFEFNVPINIEIDDKYIAENITIDIEDFYYEIINNNILEVNIEISLDNIIEKPSIEKQKEIIEYKEEKMEEQTLEMPEERCIEEEYQTEIIEENNKELANIFDNFSNEAEDFSTYYVYIVREGDSIETIMAKYNISREQLEEYNDINELKLGDKIIIPEIKNAGN